MKYGALSDHFDGVAAKRLTAVEINPNISHQHELNGVAPLRSLLGTDGFPSRPATFIWLGHGSEGIIERSSLTWYDARDRHPTRTEWRLYYPNNAVMEQTKAGDLLVIANPSEKDGDLTVIVAQQQSIFENQLVWLFGLEGNPDERFVIERLANEKDRKLDFASLYILDQLEITVEESESELLDRLLEPFGDNLPTTRCFSQHARKNLQVEVSVQDDPDAALMSWMVWEERLFRRFEERTVDQILSDITASDSRRDAFAEHAKSFLNRRKSRVGSALEHHMEEILVTNEIRYVRGARTEDGRPDFLFPGIQEYNDLGFAVQNLSMLGAKTSCKDRWRQVLSEAGRINQKHLLTLEPGITVQQTDEMRGRDLQLVLPLEVHETYREEQRDWLMSVREFVELVRQRQNVA